MLGQSETLCSTEDTHVTKKNIWHPGWRAGGLQNGFSFLAECLSSSGVTARGNLGPWEPAPPQVHTWGSTHHLTEWPGTLNPETGEPWAIGADGCKGLVSFQTLLMRETKDQESL